MDLEPILALIKALDSSSLQRLKLTSGDFTLELEKGQTYIVEEVPKDTRPLEVFKTERRIASTKRRAKI